MRIAVYHNILWPRYAGVVLSRLYALCKSRGVDVSIIQIAETEGQRSVLGAVDLAYHDYPFRLLFRGAYDDVPLRRLIPAITKDLLGRRTDLVVLPGYNRIEYWVMLALCVLFGRKCAVFCDSTKYDNPKVFWKEWAKRLFFSRCCGFFVYGIRGKEYLMSYGVEAQKITCGCQAAALPPGYDPAAVLAQYESQRAGVLHAPRFIYVGRLATEKGLIDLLDAFKVVHARTPAATMLIVGAGPLMDALLRRVGELGLEGAVALGGPKSIDEIVPLFFESSALVLPSRSEPWGMVVNEALSYGCPVVASLNCGCVPELVLNGVTGYSYETGNVEALAGAMTAAMHLSEDRIAVVKECLKVMSAFTPERAATQILNGCTRIVETGP
jgi:glycosyltransferase involved in cell wall biosynthesis